MKREAVTIERHRYVLDWFERDQMQIELKRDQFFVFEYRFGGDWYLAQYDHDGKEYVRKDWGRDDFNMPNAAKALVTLGDRVTKFTAISTNMGFSKALGQLLKRADEMRNQQRSS